MPEGGLVVVWQSGASSVFPWRVCEVFTDARDTSQMLGGSLYDHAAVSCQLYSFGGSVRCSQMPEEGLVIVWQLGASSVFV
jgi:hypothetical protein